MRALAVVGKIGPAFGGIEVQNCIIGSTVFVPAILDPEQDFLETYREYILSLAFSVAERHVEDDFWRQAQVHGDTN